ncbi:three-Cys-motif partner protein TcmP [Pseudoramibacter sp.]|jgi:three-Cys-motif partner protein|uniref:three-Cys-motif partner protein TcmP n=1 Tax=Pseudoramibacter sp. TaxID=2034862 RepID=UPI0025D1F27E|nr:three-Cys-motif partner protein TcmP [Pseudoramibacter sp.]MCH4071822.1 three-Cys-motif partner protein TcmP [Pseudoramibacter sp.]MCH4105590.1 three-Cys-motif partner protein TcmP [Pseudoramibacter sp.]
MPKQSEVITVAKPHTIKKFELIEKYIETWAEKLMNNLNCNGIIFIDCMCNSGIYQDVNGEIIEGTPIRVAKKLLTVAEKYPNKRVSLYFNDINDARVDELEKHLPQEEKNFKIITSRKDASELLKTIGPQLSQNTHEHYFLLYDPYDACIDWKALFPFFRNWGEVMINHAIRDPMRAIKCAKTETAKAKYEQTYLQEFEKLLPYGSDRNSYEKRISEIIDYLKGNRNYYVASFPFYNSKGSFLYDLIHCTSSIEGFKLYKRSAWQTFGGQSSSKNNKNYTQIKFDLSSSTDAPIFEEENCYQIYHIAQYLQTTFAGQKNVPLQDLWNVLDHHPIFPSDGFKDVIKGELKNCFGATVQMIVDEKTKHRKQTISFKAK